MTIRLLFQILAGVCTYVSANPVTSPPPASITSLPLLRRQDSTYGDDWIGWYDMSFSSEEYYAYSPESCGYGWTFTTSSTLADCCETTVSNWEGECTSWFYTGCSEQYILAVSTSIECPSDSSCGEVTIYTDSTIDSDYLTKISCVSGSSGLIFQSLPFDGLPSSDFFSQEISVSFFFTESSGTPSQSATATPAFSISSTASQTSAPVSSQETTPSKSKEASKAWIAGVVIGGLALVAIAGLAFYLMRQRRNTQVQSYQVAPQMQIGAAPNSPLPPYATPHEHKGYYGQVGNGLNQTPNTMSVYSHVATSPGVQTQMPLPGTLQTPAVQNAGELPELAQGAPGRS